MAIVVTLNEQILHGSANIDQQIHLTLEKGYINKYIYQIRPVFLDISHKSFLLFTIQYTTTIKEDTVKLSLEHLWFLFQTKFQIRFI